MRLPYRLLLGRSPKLFKLKLVLALPFQQKVPNETRNTKHTMLLTIIHLILTRKTLSHDCSLSLSTCIFNIFMYLALIPTH